MNEIVYFHESVHSNGTNLHIYIYILRNQQSRIILYYNESNPRDCGSDLELQAFHFLICKLSKKHMLKYTGKMAWFSF